MRYSQKCRVTAVLLENIRAGLDIKRSFEELIKLDLPVDIIHKQSVKDVAKRFIGIVEVQEDALKLLGQCIQKITGSSASNRAPQTMLQPSEKKTSCPSSSSSNSSSSCRSSTPSSSSTSAPTVAAAAAEKKTSEEDEKLQRFLAARKRALAVVAPKQVPSSCSENNPSLAPSCSSTSTSSSSSSSSTSSSFRPSVDMMLRSKRTAPVVVSGKPKCPAMSLDPPARVAVAQKPKKLSSEAENEKLQQFVAARKRALPGAAPKVVPAGGRPSETLSMLESSRLFRIQQAQDIKRFGEPERKRQRRNFH
ncbi:unnamed protein product [Caenorhabditis sp. 36 PRJEB53466]|nr:unnamed protein product [Caenorhabditis sp. 36 PRJEB53466]